LSFRKEGTGMGRLPGGKESIEPVAFWKLLGSKAAASESLQVKSEEPFSG
jgi:hypothetical protein